jgi:hypothetical protein
MKRQIKLYILLAILGLVVASPASADGWIFGANTGTMNIDDSDVSDPRNVGFMAGYEVGIGLGDLAFEGEITRTTSDGDLNGAAIKVETEALYVALRTAGPVYFKGRVGTLQEEIKIGNSSGTDSGTSMSIGVGFSLGLVQLELDLTRIETDITYVSVGVVF